MNNLADFDQLLDRVSSQVSTIKNEAIALREENKKQKDLLNAKELEKIRLANEKDRQIEQLEREKLALQKEKSLLEQKLQDIFKRLQSVISPESSSPERS